LACEGCVLPRIQTIDIADSSGIE
jgi:cytochrome P450